MESGGFSSPRADCFPAGLRVLVVDDDVTWLKILDKMLKKCNYEVTTCGLAREALDLLRGRKDGYDIVISDVNMPDMDGFKLLEHVGLEMDLPVIMMSVDGETSRVMKGVQHGACDYLLKPIRMKELRNIWQHVFRKRIHEVRDIEGLDEIQMMTSGNEQSDDGYLFCGDLSSGKKRKDVDNTTEDRVCGDTSSVKKVRVVWTVDLHQKFVKAVNQIGLEKVGPKKILDLMGVPWLTRENVASHLQKYRLYLSRLQKKNEFNAPFGAIEGIHVPICHQHSVSQFATTLQPHNILVNESHPVSRNDILLRNDKTKIIEGIPLTKPKKPSSGSKINFDYHFIGPLDSNVKSISTVFGQYPWSTDVQFQSLKSKQEHRPNFQTDHKFDHLTIHMYPKKVDSPQRGVAHNSSTSASQARSSTSLGKNKSQNVEEVAKDKNIPASFTVSPESRLTDIDVSGPIACPTRDTKNHSTEQNLFDDFESLQRNFFFGWDEKFNDFHLPDEYFGNMEIFGYNNHETIVDFPPHLYDPWKFDSEYVSDHMEYPVMDHGLFA